MGATPAPGFKGAVGYGTSDAFYGGQRKPKHEPGAGGRPAIPGGPPLPKNPIAVAAWEMQLARGAMNSPASTSQGYQGRLAKLTVR